MKSNSLKNIRSICDGMKGHNYALPDCLKLITECKNDYNELDFWDIAAITGDTVAQVYNHDDTTGCEYCVSGYLAGEEYYSYIFDMLSYNFEYVGAERINNASYIQKIIQYIDNGIPVLVKSNLHDIKEWHSDVGTHCLISGYDNDGKTVKLWGCGETVINYEIDDNCKLDLIFIGEKKQEVSLEEIYLKVIKKMPYWLTLPQRNGMFFGAHAYRMWADDINAGRFEGKDIDLWGNYGVYVCNLATSGGEPTYIFNKIAALNRKYDSLKLAGEKIQALLPAETPTGGRSKLWIELDELGGGMDMNTVKITMCDKEKRSKIANALYKYAERLDKG